MKTHVLFQVLLSVCLFLSVANSSYGQTRYKTFCKGRQRRYALGHHFSAPRSQDIKHSVMVKQNINWWIWMLKRLIMMYKALYGLVNHMIKK